MNQGSDQEGLPLCPQQLGWEMAFVWAVVGVPWHRPCEPNYPGPRASGPTLTHSPPGSSTPRQPGSLQEPAAESQIDHLRHWQSKRFGGSLEYLFSSAFPRSRPRARSYPRPPRQRSRVRGWVSGPPSAPQVIYSTAAPVQTLEAKTITQAECSGAAGNTTEHKMQ